MDLKISIITVCLNEIDNIEKTILSVVNQSYKNIEWVIIDGGSTDGSLEMIKQYENKIAYLSSESDDGIYNAMNKGISKASGDFLLFLNAGDYLYDNDVIKNVTNVMNQYENKDIFYGNLLFQTEDGGFNLITYDNFNQANSHAFFAYFMLGHPTIFYKKTLFELHGNYDANFKIIADLILTHKFIVEKKASTHKLNQIISVFLSGGISTNSKYRKLLAEERAIFIGEKYKYYKPFVDIDKFLFRTFATIYRPIQRILTKVILKMLSLN